MRNTSVQKDICRRRGHGPRRRRRHCLSQCAVGGLFLSTTTSSGWVGSWSFHHPSETRGVRNDEPLLPGRSWISISRVRRPLFGGSPRLFHLASIVLHAANAVLIFALAREFYGPADTGRRDFSPRAISVRLSHGPVLRRPAVRTWTQLPGSARWRKRWRCSSGA